MFQLSGKRLGEGLPGIKQICYIYGINTDEDLGEICHSEFFGVRNTVRKMFESSCRLVLKRYGIRVTDQCLKELYLSYKMFSQMELDAEMEWKLSVYFEQSLSRAHYIAKRLLRSGIVGTRLWKTRPVFVYSCSA